MMGIAVEEEVVEKVEEKEVETEEEKKLTPQQLRKKYFLKRMKGEDKQKQESMKEWKLRDGKRLSYKIFEKSLMKR